jgi:hypothetical protein
MAEEGALPFSLDGELMLFLGIHILCRMSCCPSEQQLLLSFVLLPMASAKKHTRIHHTLGLVPSSHQICAKQHKIEIFT